MTGDVPLELELRDQQDGSTQFLDESTREPTSTCTVDKLFPEKIRDKIGWTIGFILFEGLCLAMIAVGGVHWNDCPVERMIPISLVVSGSLGFLSFLYPLGKTWLCNGTRHKAVDISIKEIIIITLVNFILLVAGSVFVFKTRYSLHTPIPGVVYCDYNLYYFSFFVFEGLISLCFLSLMAIWCAIRRGLVEF